MKAVSEEISETEKCTKQYVLNVARNAKYHSSLQKESLFIAKNAIEKDENSNHFIALKLHIIFSLFLFF